MFNNKVISSEGPHGGSGELSMAKVPHAIIYKLNPLSGWLAYKILKIKYVDLVNIMSDEEIIPECLQDDCNFDKIMLELNKLTGQNGEKQIERTQKALSMLGAGQALTPSQKAAKQVLKIIEDYKNKNG